MIRRFITLQNILHGSDIAMARHLRITLYDVCHYDIIMPFLIPFTIESHESIETIKDWALFENKRPS